ncbi:MAG: isomerase, partial [Methylococcaceae bacterium]|nr:isomerase [Methylococcaceae bacterium]
IDEFSAYQQKHPQWGMPYAMPGLSLKHESILLKWLKEGAKIDPRPQLSEKALSEILKWESFFNGTSLKQELVSRYIYEHLFIGHLHFQGHSDDEFFQLVRSTTAPGQAIREIATIRPYENPGPNQFYYRLRPVVSTIVDKTHFVYELSDKKMQRYHELFFQTDYLVKQLPSYQTEYASNPFKTFIDIPPASRYKFLLDDAHYFVSGFIKGPVCRGKIALNVIRDRFWVVFIKPELEFSEKSTQFLAENSSLLTLPGAAGDSIGLFDWRTYDGFGKQYLNRKEKFINQSILNNRRLNLDFIWDGNGENNNAALTIFRHSDSATVVKGLLGKTPLTGWVIDYPILERIHYLLVAGFNVYGSAGHQLASRKYMDYLRVDGENNFLRFMPKGQRQKLHSSWYKGLGTKLFGYTNEPLFSINHETGITYKTINFKKEFFDLIRSKMGKAAGQLNSANECKGDSCFNVSPSLAHQKIEQQLSKLSNLKGKQLELLPEVSFLRVKAQNSKDDSVFSLLLNKAYKNIAFMLAEDYRHEPENDTLTVVPGFIGSYPNFFFSVEQDELADFIEQLANAKTETAKELLYSHYGIRRSNPEIWTMYDWFNEQYKKQQGKLSGIFDMNRYQNL